MDGGTLLLFFITVFPLILTPGPDIIFTASQGLARGRAAALKAVAGILLGYTAHGILSAFGIAALVSASPFLFSVLKWIGVIYLFWLSAQILYSAFSKKGGIRLQTPDNVSLWRGFFTSFLNPKGLLMYLAILPQFISPGASAAVQALILSILFILGCATVYSAVGVLASRAHGSGISAIARRRLETFTGLMLAGAALKLAGEVH
ncbi:LysE family translocator [Desulforhopalus singaporensis]|uniref:Threonine/homoserine/homoserine lactone efflux protein n=1 Tax=Desulforhopalus singaporensis TaxID=91360 RepID=A0A1H0SBH1_9BACT|nr:LysE family translocator [Desulforhopalus singaporensis]SDP39005.1 Threonine/homoserine/homoserine lactone efflux protein [Desulforhopalus singaporensis]